MYPVRIALAGLGLLLLSPGPMTAQQDSGSHPMTVAEFEASLHYKSGSVTLPGNLATLEMPDGYRFLDGHDGARVLEAWGNPPGAHVLGILVPPGMAAMSDSSWAVVVTFQDDGYVKDDDADKINYSEMLQQMQKDAADENEARAKDGYPAVELIGWAEPPHYDRASHKLYWAKELKFGDRETHTLNYAVRVLGRRGVLVLNAVATMSQLPTVKDGMQHVMGFVNFNQGHRYTDFVSGTDKVAAYGIGALVLGTVAAKAGLLKVIIAGLLAAKKFLIIAAAGVAAFFKRLFGRKKVEPAASPPAA